MRNFKRIIQNSLLITGVFLFLIQMPVNAFNGAILKGIKIDQLMDQSYKITVKTDKDVPIKKYVTAANKVVLDLKNVRPAQFINTTYNNATEVDHVIVQPSSGNNLRIFLQGLNMASSKIILDTRDEALNFLQNDYPTEEENFELMTDQTADQGNAPVFIDLSDEVASNTVKKSNNSVDKIKSVTPVLSYQERSRNNFTTMQNSMMNVSSDNNVLGTNIFDWTLRLLALAIIIAAAIKMFAKPKKVEINLAADNLKNREMELYKAADARKELLTKSLGKPATGVRKPGYSSISQYGLNEYKNSNLPPKGMSTSTPSSTAGSHSMKLNSALKNTNIKSTNTQQQTKLRPVNPTKISKQQTAQAQENFDGTKFLETMASIYQKSGRSDLANGIRQNMLRKQA